MVKAMIFRALLVCILIIFYLAINSTDFVNLITIKEYIHQHMTTGESSRYFGMITTRFGEEKFTLKTAFYESCIINKDFILSYLKELPWLTIIIENHFNCAIIKELILAQYKEYIASRENLQILAAITKYTIFDAKMDAAIILKDYIKCPKEIPPSTLYTWINEILNGVDWKTYMQTIDYRSGELNKLKEFSIKQILFYSEQYTANVISVRKNIGFDEKEFLDHIIESFAVILGIVWVLPETLYHSIFKNYIERMAVNIGQKIVNDIIARAPNSIIFDMNAQEMQDFMPFVISMGITQFGVLGVFLVLVKIYYFS